ncbi:MAG: T9SS type A sorting domain-containing protein [Salinivirgaceae bacterium]|jgi:hypothetical protein|nr:T9SS type A sorting domain-containing protein [Salinivirgaceae bacterium]
MKHLYFLFFLVMLSVGVCAQPKALSMYEFYESNSGEYYELPDGELVTPSDWDDGVTDPIELGFEFNYNGENYTHITVNTNGTINFGNAAINEETNDLASNEFTNLLAPLWDDLKFYSAGDGDGIYVKQIGEGENSTFGIEFRQVGRYNSEGLVNFQVFLFGVDNHIEFYYGDMSPAANWHEYSTVSIGMNAPASSGTEFISVTPDAVDGATISTDEVNNAIMRETLGQITAGTTYHFTPPIVITDYDIGVDEILSPGSGFLTNEEIVSVKLTNPGRTIHEGLTMKYQLYDANGCVISEIGDPVFEPFTDYPIDSLSEVEFTFDQPLDLSANRKYGVLVKAILDGDINAENDSLGKGVQGIILGEPIYTNGPIVTHEGAGPDGADLSVVKTEMNMWNYGYNTNYEIGYRNADEFTVPEGETWIIHSLGFYNWQTESGLTPTINHLDFRIFADRPNVENVDTIVNYYDINKLSGSRFSGIYRVYDTEMQNTDRPIMLSVSRFNENGWITLSPGTYWLDFSSGGTLTSGPWVPFVTYPDEVTTGNAMHLGFGGWVDWIEDGTETAQGMPFMLYGERVTGIANEQTPKMQIYPNPTRDIVQVATVAGGALTVTDLTGKVLVQQKAQSHETIDLSSFHNGIYIVTVQTKQGTARQKVILNR